MKIEINEIIKKAWQDAFEEGLLKSESLPSFDVSETKSLEHGDYSSNIAMVSARLEKNSPLKIAEVLKAKIQSDFISRIDIAGPGFINFFIKKDHFPLLLAEIYEKADSFGRSDYGQGEKIQVEFVSANPTGPLHIGHGRGAAVGDAVASILGHCGYDVQREYYINDSGRQINTLGRSVYLRYLEIYGRDVDFPSDHYQGEYIKDIAAEVKESHNESLLEMNEDEAVSVCAKYAAGKILDGIRTDLENFGVRFDNWFSEQSLYDSSKVGNSLKDLEGKGIIYDGDGAKWFKTTEYGDEKDRVVVRSNGDTTYFASDIAYHMDKFTRGFSQVIDVWGADHHGYIKRIKAAVEASGYDPDNFHVILVQLVTLLRSGKLVQMSTRSGEFDTLSEVLDEVGVDAARFFFLMRSYDSGLDFDLDLAKKKSSENPVYYVQYVHARICSMLEKASAENGIGYSDIEGCNKGLLVEDEELSLIKKLMVFPEVVLSAGKTREPHKITYYLMELAGLFHAYYNRHKVLVDDKELASSRLYLVNAVKIVVKNGLGILGITAPEKM